MKSMNHLNKVLLVSLIALPFTSSNFLAGDESSVVGSEVISRPSLVSRVYGNIPRVYDRAVNSITTRVAQHSSMMAFAGCSLAVLIGKSLYDRLPTVSSVSSKAKTCGSYLLSGTKKAYDSCASGTKACGSLIKNHKRTSGLFAGAASAGLLALDLWKKPMGNNPISATAARGLLSCLNNHKRPVVIGTAVITGLGLWGSRLIGKKQGVASKEQTSSVANSTEEVAKNPVTPGVAKPAAKPASRVSTEAQLGSQPQSEQVVASALPRAQQPQQRQDGSILIGPIRHLPTCSCANGICIANRRGSAPRGNCGGHCCRRHGHRR